MQCECAVGLVDETALLSLAEDGSMEPGCSEMAGWQAIEGDRTYLFSVLKGNLFI